MLRELEEEPAAPLVVNEAYEFQLAIAFALKMRIANVKAEGHHRRFEDAFR